jgi:cytochrome c
MPIFLKKRYIVEICLSLCFCIPASATDLLEGKELARKNLCIGCHAEKQKVVGPAFVEIANRYDNSPQSYSYLMNKIKNGGVGVWGAIPMPANKNNITDEEIRIVVNWIFGMKKNQK